MAWNKISYFCNMHMMDSAQAKELFDVNGFVNYGRILNDEQLTTIRSRVKAICGGKIAAAEGSLRFHTGMTWLDSNGTHHPEAVWQLLHPERYDEAYRRICELPAIRNMMELLLDGTAQFWSSQVIMKNAVHGNALPWHQDTSYWGQEPRMTCWVALDDATPENGCMRMIPGSHRQGQLAFTRTPNANVGESLLHTDGHGFEERQVYVPVPAGCARFHHPLTVHASSPNNSPHHRRAVAITYEAWQSTRPTLEI